MSDKEDDPEDDKDKLQKGKRAVSSPSERTTRRELAARRRLRRKPEPAGCATLQDDNRR